MTDPTSFAILGALGLVALGLGIATNLDFERVIADLARQTGDGAVRLPAMRRLLRGTFVLLAAVGAGFLVLGALLGFGVVS
ncbi:hypothetical protein [Amnibacterium kyonggiense]